MFPIVTLTFWTTDPYRGAFDLERVAHSAEIELKRVAGTRDVYTIGGPSHVVRVHRRAGADECVPHQRTGHPRRRCNCPMPPSPRASW